MTSKGYEKAIHKGNGHQEQIFLDPDPGEIIRQAKGNGVFFHRSDKELLGHPLVQRRIHCRREIAAAIREYYQTSEVLPGRLKEDGIWIITGHQGEFYHCGILTKYILAQRLAELLGGEVVNLVLDHDLPGEFSLALPIRRSQRLERHKPGWKISQPDLPLEYQPLPHALAWESFLRDAGEAGTDETAGETLQKAVEILEEAYETAENLAHFYAQVNQLSAEPLSLRWNDLPVSLMAQTDSFGVFAADLLRNAPRVHRLYNENLASYRQQKKMRNGKQPLPDLSRNGERLEIPFWLFAAHQARRRLFVEPGEENSVLSDGQNKLAEVNWGTDMDFDAAGMRLKEALVKQGIQLRPRALTLTLFVRLFLADYFVHGWGGRRYERLNDMFIRTYYHLEPPGYGAMSANLYLLSSQYPPPAQIQEQINQLAQQQRDCQNHPERYLDQADDRPRAEKLIEQKELLVKEGQKLKETNAPSSRRQEVFQQLQEIQQQLAECYATFAARNEAKMKQAKEQLREAEIAYDREYFFGLFPPPRLQDLKNRIDKSLPDL